MMFNRGLIKDKNAKANLIVEFKNVALTYKQNGVHALNGISFDILPGEFIYVIGSTGAGKSTIIGLLNGSLIPDKGEIYSLGYNVPKISNKKLYLYRQKVGVVFQDYKLLEDKTVSENIAFVMECLDKKRDEINKRKREVLSLTRILEKAHSRIDQLSGGQAQRVAIARAIANKPKLLLCDEPTGNLDPEMTETIYQVLERINLEEKTTIIVVTHNIEMVKRHPHRTIELDHGYIVSDKYGVSDNIFNLGGNDESTIYTRIQ